MLMFFDRVDNVVREGTYHMHYTLLDVEKGVHKRDSYVPVDRETFQKDVANAINFELIIKQPKQVIFHKHAFTKKVGAVDIFKEKNIEQIVNEIKDIGYVCINENGFVTYNELKIRRDFL